jgi:hypothetical protein
MEHTVIVGMDVDTLKQLDDLRRAHPNIPSRVQVIKRLIWEAHAKIAEAKQVEAQPQQAAAQPQVVTQFQAQGHAQAQAG